MTLQEKKNQVQFTLRIFHNEPWERKDKSFCLQNRINT